MSAHTPQPDPDTNLARLSGLKIHIMKSYFISLCGLESVLWHRGFHYDERVMCKRCLKKAKTAQ